MCLTFLAVGFTACNEDDDYFKDDAQNSSITIKKVYLEDAESSVPDREVSFARLGQIIRLEGEGFFGVKKVYINGFDTYFNRTYVSNTSMMVQLNSKTPIAEAEESVRNTIRLVKDGSETIYKELIIRAASPSITSVSNTLPKSGEKIIVRGANLQETILVTLPGGTEVTDIENDEDGEWFSFRMPSGVTASGSITSEGANGTAVSPAYFNENSCYIIDYDGNGAQGFWSWTETGSMCNADDLADDPMGSGRGKCAMLVPQRILDGEAGGVISGKSRATEWWTAGNDSDLDDWSRMYSVIPATTPVTEVALQFDIYVPEAWSTTGHMQISLFNNFNFSGIGSDDDGANNQVTFYVPWIQEGSIVPFATEGWQTVTIPFSQLRKYATLIEKEETPTFQMVVDDRNAATYRNFGFGFVNRDFTYNGVAVEATLFNKKVYIDNWRIVPCKAITVSDFPEEEAGE